MAIVALLALAGLPGSAQAAPPANDNFAAAQLITGTTASVTGTLSEATKETGEPNHYSHSGNRSVWYRWVAPIDGVAEVSLSSANWDVLGVYTGNTVDGLTTVGSSHGDRIRFRVTSGAVYYFAVDYCNDLAFTLNLTSSPRPANDDFGGAQELSGTEATATGSTLAATREGGEPAHGSYTDKSIWYSWTAPWTGAATIATAGSNFDTVLAVYTGDALGGLIKVGANDNASSASNTSNVSFHAVAGTTYRIAVDGYSGASGSVALALRMRDTPVNDAFSAAIDLPSETKVTATGRNDGASAEIGEPSHYNFNPAASSVWYRWTAPKDGSLTVKGSATWAPALAAYRGDQVSNLTRVPNQAQPCCPGANQIRLRVDAGVTYLIAVDSVTAGTGGDFALSLDLIDRPPNDDFANAQVIAGVSVDVNGTNLGATQEVGEPIHEQNYYDPSVWYSWTAPSTGGVTIDTAGSTFQTVTSVYTGNAVNALTRVPSTPNSTPSQRIKRSFRAVAGQTYRIAVDGAGAAQGDIKLALRFRGVPANDMFAAAQPLASGITSAGDNIGATGEPGEPGSGGTAGATVWYSWTPATTSSFTVEFTRLDFNAGLNVYTGNSVDGLTRVSQTNYRYAAQPGTTYWIAVDGGSGPNRGTFDIRLDSRDAPANDSFANAIELTGTSDTESGVNTYATRESGEPTHISGGNSSVWYRWTAPQSGPMTIDLAGSGYDIYGAVYTGSSVNALTKVGSGKKVKFNAVEGTTYRIAADGYYGYYGNVRVALIQGTLPVNDLFANAVELTGEADSETGTNDGASRETGEPSHTYSGSASIWYRWTAPRTGPAVIDLNGSFYDAYAVVYSGTQLTSLTPMGGGKKIKFRAVQGTTYRIAVDGSYGSVGPVQLALSMPPAPANDDFDNAVDLTGESDTKSGSNLNATAESGEPQHAYSGGGSVWYRWTAPRSGTVGITTTGSSGTLTTAVYTGSAVNALSRQTSSTYAITLKVTAGTTYRIAVDGEYGRMSDFQLALAMKTPPANDDFANAIEMTGTSDQENGNNSWASNETGEPTHVSSGGSSVWYQWTAPSTGLASVDLASSQYYIYAIVYTGDSVGGLTRVAAGKSLKFRAVAGQTYRIAVDSAYGYTASFELRTGLATPPANDDFANATDLTGAADAETGTNQNATVEPSEPVPYYSGGSSVWYRWTAPRTGAATIDLEGSSFDTQVAVYTGDSVSGLSRVAGVRGKKVTFRAQEGTTYRIQVDGYYGATGSIQLALSMAPPPANDDFANAAAISGENTSTAGSTMGATRETGEPTHSSSGTGETVWYRWTAARNGYLTVKVTPASNFTATAAAYRGSALGALSKVSSTAGSMSFYVRRGDVLHVAVEGTNSGSGLFTLTTAVDPAPAHDDFADAKTLTGDHVSETSTVANASIQPGEPSHGTSSWNSVWYRWTAPATGRATLDLTGSGFPYVGAVYTGSALSNLQRVTWSSTSPMPFEAQAGETYWIAVASRTGAQGTVKLALDLVPRPANDDFANATVLAGDSADDTGDNRAATAEAGEPAHDNAASKSVWWRWTAPSDGETTIDLSGSSFDTTLAVYTGSDVGSLTRVVRDDQAGAGDTSRVTFTATEGTTYSIAVDSFAGGTGSIAFALRHVAAPDPPAEEQPAEEEQQQSDPPAEEQQQQDPPAEEQQQQDPPAEEQQQDPPVEEQQQSDPPAEEQQQSDPPAEQEQQQQDPPAEQQQQPAEEQQQDQPASTSTHQDPAPSGTDSNTSGSVPSPGPAAPAGTEELVLTTNFTQQKLKTVLSKGLTAMVACQSACAVDASATLDPATAKKLRLKAAGAPVGSAAVQANGPTKVVLKLSAAAKRKLAQAKSLKLTVRFTARSGSRTTTVTRTLTIKR